MAKKKISFFFCCEMNTKWHCFYSTYFSSVMVEGHFLLSVRLVSCKAHEMKLWREFWYFCIAQEFLSSFLTITTCWQNNKHWEIWWAPKTWKIRATWNDSVVCNFQARCLQNSNGFCKAVLFWVLYRKTNRPIIHKISV